MKRFFHSELVDLRGSILLMGERALDQLTLAFEGLSERDVDKVGEVLQRDDDLDQLELKIDTEVIRYISLRAPVATELRLLTTAMKMAHDLERVGDECCTMAKRSRELLDLENTLPLLELPAMSRLVGQLLRDAMDALVNEDLQLAGELPKRDKEVDQWNKEHFGRYKRMVEDGSLSVDAAISLIFISKALERIGDHATNLAESVVFMYGGEDIRHSDQTRRI